MQVIVDGGEGRLRSAALGLEPLAPDGLNRLDDLWAYLVDRGPVGSRADGVMYRALAGRTTGPLLEYGCGTGRILDSLTELGRAVWGVDTAPAMLRRARARARDSRRLSLIRGNMRDVETSHQYGLIVLSRSVLGYVAEPESVRTVLHRIRRMLAPDGLVVIDHANLAQVTAELQDARPAWRVSWDEYLRAQVRDRSTLSWRYRPSVLRITDRFLIRRPGRDIRLSESADIRLYRPEQMARLLDEARLQTEQFFGSYELGAYEPRTSDRMIVVARPAA